MAKPKLPKVAPKVPSSGALPSPLSQTGQRLKLGEQGANFDIAMSKYLSNERLSKAESELLGLYHPAGGGVKLSKMPSEYTAEYDMPRELSPSKVITPESMLGSASIPLVGDSADAGKRLIAVNGLPLSGDVNLEGGSRFMRDNPDAWASGQGVVTVLNNQIERALQGVDKVYGPHVSMSGTGGDFNTMTTKTLLNMFDPSDLSVEAAQLFDNRVRTTPVKNQKTGEIRYPYADFVGIQHPELRDQLLSKKEGTGNLRKAFVETMNKAEFQKMGFPEPAAARFATSDPVLINKPIGSTGYEIAEFTPGERVITDPLVPHETYPVHIKGEHAGSLADTVPAEVYFKDYFNERRLLGSPKSSDTRAFTMSSPIQYHDQAWLDNLMGFITARDAKIKAGEYADGGMVETPAQEAIADTVQNPNAARMLEMDLANLSLMQQPRRMAEGGNVASPEERQRLFYEKRQKLPEGVVEDTGQADGVYQEPTVASETSRVFGMDPKADRLSILPRYSREEGLVAPQFLYDAAKAITAPSVAARGYEVAPEEALNLAMNVAGGGFGASAAMRNPTGKGGKDLGMFVGQKSNTWDMDKYEMAIKMDKAGISPEEINRYTGYYKNPASNVWSQEISDASAKLVGKMPESVGDTVPLGSIVRHENLFYAYPDLKNIPVTREAGAGATYSPDKNTISIGTEITDPLNQLKALIHEAQHSVQNKEHFPRGTNKGEMEQFITPEMAKINERLGELFYADKRNPKNEKEFNDLTKKIRQLKKQQKADAFETYMRAEGEAQARAVEERMLFSEKQRRDTLPTASFDRPMSQLHQLYANGGAVKMRDGGDPEKEFIDQMKEEFSVYNKPTYGNEIPGTPTIDQQRYELTMKGQQEAENRARTTRDNLTAMDPSGTLGIVDALKTVGKSIVSPFAYYGGNAFDWLQTGKVDPVKSQARKESIEEWITPKTQEGGEFLEEVSKIGPAITGSEMGFGMHPNLWVSGIGMTTPKQTAAGLRLGSERVKPFAKDVGAMASELYESGKLPYMPSPNLYATAPDGKPSKVLAPANEIGFYSPTEAAALNLQRKSGQGQAFLNDIMKGENVKSDEISAMGLDTFLKDKKNITADEVRDYIAQNKIQLGETVYGGQIKEDPVGIAKRKEVFDKYEPEIQSLYKEAQQIEYSNPRYKEIENRLNDIQLKRDAESDAVYTIPENKDSKFSSYALPGGENYREIVLTLPQNMSSYNTFTDGLKKKYGEMPLGKMPLTEIENARLEKYYAGEDVKPYQSSHWDEPNALAHLRVSDRVTDGKKTLLVDEVQSDWHQQGRERGYVSPDDKTSAQLEKELTAVTTKRSQLLEEAANLPDSEMEKFKSINEEIKRLSEQATQLDRQWTDSFNNPKKVPDAPYKDDWYQLTLRRAIKEAIDGGYDRVALPTGSRVAERFDLSKQIDRIDYNKNDDGTYSMSAIKGGKQVFSKEGLDENELSGIVGKDVAKKMVGDEGAAQYDADIADELGVGVVKSLTGLDLQVGGKGMKKYYDEIYPNYLKKFGKKYGSTIGKTTVDVDGKPEPLHYMEITPAMRKEFSTGIPMKHGGKVQFAKSLDAMRHELTKAK